MPEQVTPEVLAATFEQTATWMATRPAGVTWTGDGLDGTVAGLRDAAKSIRGQLAPAWDALTRERDALERDLSEQEAHWPKCPDGCGCRLATGDADARECGCDGPCTMECRENGYPDAPSYRDLAVRHAMDERDEARAELQEVHDALVAAYGRDDLTEGAEALLAGALASERDEAREQLAVQHEAMSQLRADHSETLARAEHDVSAALKTVARWQGENARLIAENGRYRAALERILGRTGTDDRAVILAMRADARAALEPQ